MGKTKKPTGLSITRKENKFTIAWKIASANHGAGQKLEYRTRRYDNTWRKDWHEVTVGKTVTSKVVTIDMSSFHPSDEPHFTGIKFRIKGRRSPYTEDNKTRTPDWSKWVEKSMEIEKPKKPTLTATLGNQSNITTFAWSIDVSDSDQYLFTSYQYESILLNDCTEKKGSNLDWSTSNAGYKTGTGTSSSGSLTVTEDTATLANGSYTRWFRVRSRGPAGDSSWVYAKHVYATPWVARISETKGTVKSGKTLVEVTWKAPSNAAHPIDETTVEYCIGTPTAGMALPASPTWNVADTSKDTKEEDKAAFYIEDTLGNDECLWVRVVTKHDSRTNYSSSKLVLVGHLPNPSNLSVSVSGSTATISATNNSSAAPYTGSDSSVKRQFLEITYRGAKENKDGYVIGIIPSGSSSVSVTLPDQTNETAYTIGARAVVGTYSGTTIKKEAMSSDTVWTDASVPKPPTGVALDFDGYKLDVSWTWAWENANKAELSWSDNPDAWESTEEPQKYEIDRKVTKWSIIGLEAGKEYYVKVRLISTEENDTIEGPWSDRKSLYLAVEPAKPILKLSAGQITKDGKVTASWNYTSGDGTDQNYAEICVMSGNTYGDAIAHAQNEQHITIYAAEKGWQRGNKYKLALRVKSASGRFSEYSDPVTVEVAPLCQASITSDSLSTVTVQDDTGITRNVTALTVMPLTITVAGAGRKGTTEIAIERAEDYVLERPDEAISNGFKGETVFLTSFIGEGTVTITNDNISGFFDDGAKYTIIVTVSDTLGQSTTVKKHFEVHWSHQALIPNGTAVIDGLISKITPIAPSGIATGDYCDIYRLSVDKPVLIYPNAEFGQTYVDPYPAIGEHGGHRIVFRTKNGDYITAGNQLAWKDIYDTLNIKESIIDFETDSVMLAYNMELSSSWKKDFRLTKYLGGSVQGDWDPAIERNSTIKAVGLTYEDPDMIHSMRRLAEHTGICHIRTVDGSSYSADVQVTESSGYDTAGKIATFDITITRIDPEDYDGMTLDAWEDQ